MLLDARPIIGETVTKSKERGYISGKTSRESNRGRTHVHVLRRSDLIRIQTQKSNNNGSYIFYGIPLNTEYVVVSIDPDKQYNAAIADRITPIEVQQ